MNINHNPATARSGERADGGGRHVNAAVQESQRKAFVFYSNWYSASAKSLSEDELARFVLVLVKYACEGIPPDDTVSPVLLSMFELVCPAIDADLKKYDKIAETNRKRAEKRKKTVAENAEARCVENQRTTDGNPIINNQQSIISNQQSTSEKEKEEEAHVRFSDVEAYWKERGFRSDAREFFDYYDARGWLNRRAERLQSWKKAAILWEDKFRRDVLPMRRREQAAEQAAARVARNAEAQQLRAEAREERAAEARQRAATAVTKEVGRRMYDEALRLCNGDDDRAIELLRRADDDPALFRRLANPEAPPERPQR